ncbi:hypothetical protein A2Z10_00420 [Candidatus Azambacteria bacterium RBG_16_47_10]|uniref:Uncharacterized protein n=1 Tax=Candidatus Azambacteria bacterium RBG_16_47_10 TaxID=1797292 RepID=A0A1F5AYH0_9BACT|nr:MAG: hypothetical protein A2Z10_00420 [Candidatus Azambacteria bacterium RBG_16_47_10]
MEQHFEETPRERVLHEEFDAIQNDPHLEGVLWDDLEVKDMALLEKLLHGTLADADISRRTDELETEGRARGDASVDFAVMLRNKLISQKYFEGHKTGNA